MEKKIFFGTSFLRKTLSEMKKKSLINLVKIMTGVHKNDSRNWNLYLKGNSFMKNILQEIFSLIDIVIGGGTEEGC